MASQDLIDHYKLKVNFHADHTRHISYSRKRKAERQWYRVKSLGRGGYGTVWLERERETSSERAVKEVPKRTNTGPRIDYARELLAMAKFSRFQDSFVQFYGWFESVDTVFLAMEYFELGDLHNFLKIPLVEDEARLITTQLLEGLIVMHEHKFTHRDLKPQNILVVERSPNWWVKIGDFGISKRIESDSTALRTQAGTRHFQAPAAIGCTGEGEESFEYTNAVDIWSLGNMVRFSQGTAPFPAGKLKDCHASEECIAFIRKLIVPRASARLDAKTALQSPWLEGVAREEEDMPPTSPLDSKALPEPVPSNEQPESSAVRPLHSDSSYDEINTSTELPEIHMEPSRQLAETNPVYRSRQVITALPEDGVNVGHTENTKSIPLHSVSSDGQVEAIVELLDTQKADEDMTRVDEITPLHVAAHGGDHAAAKLLIDAGSQKSAKTSQKATALHLAAQEGHEAIVQLLLDGKFPAEDRTHKGYTALHLAAQTGQAIVIKQLLGYGADIEARENRQWTPLHLAAQDGQIGAIKVLLEMGADTEALTCVEDSNFVPVHLAAYRGHSMAVQLLLNASPQKIAVSKKRYTPLHFAAQEGHDAAVTLLLENNVPVDCRTETGFTPLHLAAEMGHLSVIKILTSHGANIEATEASNWRPLHQAAQEGQTAAMKLLLQLGADKEARKSDGLKALDVAAYKGHLAAVELLLNA
ncbi:hypothetical protein MMC28_005815 [Mycoblastus sanguinarius]|nr:hypothetical protein [Mycoblastus sanguinarius]